MNKLLVAAAQQLFSTFGSKVTRVAVTAAAGFLQVKLGVVLDVPTQVSLSLGIYGLTGAALERLARGRQPAS